MTTPSVVPFRVKVPNGAIEDLRTRLDLTRWPEAETTGDWRQGVRLDWLRDLAGYWAADYEWRRCEQRINAFPQYTTTIDDLEIHFIHRPSPVADAVPLLMTHGWPGSIVEFLDVIDALADPSQSAEGGPAFHVVCPSLPGFGFSAHPSRTGWGPERVAAAWTRLMTRLGYERFFVQGGDWGAFVSTAMAERFPDRVAGVHVNMPVAPPDPATADDYTPAEQRALADIEQMSRTGRGYSAIQSTRPQTIGYALVDSPAALCAWITDKFWAWTDHRGDPYEALTRDQMLDNVSVYWFTSTGASAGRIYWEGVQTQPWDSIYRQVRHIAVPAGISIFPKEIQRPSRRWCERYFHDLRYFDEPARGGHFAAFEQPQLFVDQVRRAVRSMRQLPNHELCGDGRPREQATRLVT